MEVVSRHFPDNRTFGKAMKIVLLFLVLFFLTNKTLHSQVSLFHIDGTDLYPRYVSALFLTIAPDARSAGMGDVGAASEQDVYSQYWNPAKYAFMEKNSCISFTYTPWITNLVPGVKLLSLNGYYKIGDKNSVSSSFRYFSQGKLDYRMIGVPTKIHPYEFYLDVGYSKRITDHFSGGIVLRYIHSYPTNGWQQADGSDTQPGRAFSGDIGLYYHNDLITGEKKSEWALGMNISNIGTPISYYGDQEHKIPIPTNLRVGGRFTMNLNQNNSLSLHLDINKHYCPTKII